MLISTFIQSCNSMMLALDGFGSMLNRWLKALGRACPAFVFVVLASCQATQDDVRHRKLSPKQRLEQSLDRGNVFVFVSGKVDFGYEKFGSCFNSIGNLISGDQLNQLLAGGARLIGGIQPPVTKSFRSILSVDPEKISRSSGRVRCTYSSLVVDRKSVSLLKNLVQNNRLNVEQKIADFMKKRMPLVKAKQAEDELIFSLRQELERIR